MTLFTIKKIANYMLKLGSDSEEPLSNLKLQKLCYYAQGLHLAVNDKPLFEDELQAWTHGPVNPFLYNEYRSYGSNGIPPDSSINAENINADTRKFLNEVHEVYGQFSAWKLRDMSHSEPPWMNAFEQGANTIITHESMKKFFKTRIN